MRQVAAFVGTVIATMIAILALAAFAGVVVAFFEAGRC